MFEAEFRFKNQVVLRTYTAIVPAVGEQMRIGSDRCVVQRRYWVGIPGVVGDALSVLVELSEKP